MRAMLPSLLGLVAPPVAGPGAGLDLHAPDGFLSIPIAALMWLLTLVVVGVAAVSYTHLTLPTNREV